MALPFLSGKKRDQVVSVDLGGRTTKAVQMQRKGDRFELLSFAVMDAPIYEKTLTADLVSEHLKSILQALEAKTRVLALSVGVGESVVRHADLPQMPVSDMRQVLRNNTKNYLQQDLSRHAFDCHIIPPRNNAKTQDKTKPQAGPPKYRVLVAGAREQLLADLQAAVKSAGATIDMVAPGLVGPVNAFEMAMPEVFSKEVIALVDIGFKNTTISILQEGDLLLSRVVAIGGDRMTTGLAEVLSISYAEAEGIKIGMPTEVQTELEAIILPLGRELRASIDFYEHQNDRAVSRVYVSGGSSRSDLVMQMLQSELMVDCLPWNPTTFLQPALPPQQMIEIEQVAPQLAVAVGAAVATLS